MDGWSVYIAVLFTHSILVPLAASYRYSQQYCRDTLTGRQLYVGEVFTRPGQCVRVQCLGTLRVWEDTWVSDRENETQREWRLADQSHALIFCTSFSLSFFINRYSCKVPVGLKGDCHELPPTETDSVYPKCCPLYECKTFTSNPEGELEQTNTYDHAGNLRKSHLTEVIIINKDRLAPNLPERPTVQPTVRKYSVWANVIYLYMYIHIYVYMHMRVYSVNL